MVRTLIRTDHVEVGDRTVAVRYFEQQTERGLRRYSAEILLDAHDRVILDDDSLVTLETRARRVVPATYYSRRLASRATAA